MDNVTKAAAKMKVIHSGKWLERGGVDLVEVWVFELFIVCFLFQLDENVADLVELGDFRLGCQKRQIESLRFSLAAADERIASMHELNLCAEQEVKLPSKLSYISVIL